MRTLRRRYLRQLAEVICRAPWLFVAAGFCLAIVAGWYAFAHLEFKTSRNDLIGRESAYWRLFSEYAREFHAEEDYVIVVESDDPGRNRAAIDALVTGLLGEENNPHPGDATAAQQFVLTDLYYHVRFDRLEPWFLYYLTTGELRQIGDALGQFKQLVTILQQDPRLSQFYDSMNLMLQQLERAGPADRAEMEAFLPTITRIVRQMATFEERAEEAALLSPWASAFFSDEMLGQAEEEMKWQGYQTFLDGRMFIALVHPRAVEPADTAPHAATIPKLRRIIRDVRQQFPELTINLTGEPVLAYDEMQSSQQDAVRATLLTLVLIAALFALSFHELLRPLLAVLAMILVVLMSLGYATLVVGHLNLITVTFAVMILGLGIDLGIQFIARYEEERSAGADRAEAVTTTMENAGPSILTAGLTNAAAFFAMTLSGFRGVTELGIIAGGGMLIATMVTLLVLPSLLLFIRRRRESTEIPARIAATRVEQVLLRRPVAVLAACAVLVVVALSIGWRVRFDYNVLNLQSRGLESVETELRLLGADAESTIFAAVVADTMDETRKLHDRLAALDSVATVHSIAEVIPTDQEAKQPLIARIRERMGEVIFAIPAYNPADSAATLRSLAKLRVRASKLAADAQEAGAASSAAVVGELAEALREARGVLGALEAGDRDARLADYQQRFYGDLETQLRLMAGQADRPMLADDLPEEIQRMLIGRSGKFLIRVFPRENIWERDALVRFVEEIQSVAPKATGTPLGLYEFVDLLLRGYRNAALWALLVIVLLVMIDLRSIAATVLTVLPLLVGMIWMLGAMVLLGVRLNPANIIVLPLLVGIGVAYGIYVVQRYAEDHSAEFYHKSTGRAVVLSALTTIVAFSSLVLGLHRGIRSLGMVMSIGVGACLVAALLLLPSLLELARRRGWKL